MKIVLVTGFLVLSMTVYQCTSTPPKFTPYEFIDEHFVMTVDSVVYLERTACYGSCPVYRLAYVSDGRVFFEGSGFTDQRGLMRGTADRSNFQNLVQQMTSAGFQSLNDEYLDDGCSQLSTDSPSAIVILKLGGQLKRVNHYHGCNGFPGEMELLSLEEAIDSLTNSKRWVGQR
ncbi:MAG: DUF6438 domain-containing protein [Bacteroidota bacterium]